MKILIIGAGVVGKATGEFLAKRHEVVYKDVGDSWEVANGCELAVVCVPTPQGEDGQADTSIVRRVVLECPVKNIVIKSTVPPGYTAALRKPCKPFIVAREADMWAFKKMKPGALFLVKDIEKDVHFVWPDKEKDFAFAPEFIGEGNYPAAWWTGEPHQTDMTLHNSCVIGGEGPAAKMWYEAVKFLYNTACRFYHVSTTEAEMVKYMINNWLATKITFCNEMAAICDSMDIHWPRVREAWLGDNRVGRSHTTVDNGYGGKCLPKDLAAMIAAARSHGYVPELLEQVRASNDKFGGES